MRFQRCKNLVNLIKSYDVIQKKINSLIKRGDFPSASLSIRIMTYLS